MLASVIVLLQLITLPVVFSMATERDTDTDGRDEADPEPSPEIAPQHFSGAEPGRTDTFSIEGGLTVFEIEHNRGGNFIAVLEDSEFERVTGLVNTIGEFDGSTARHVEAGEYVLAMNGRDWSVTVAQPRYQEGDAPPVSFSGENFAATDPFEIAEPPEPEAEADAESDDEEAGTAGDEGGDDEGPDAEESDGEADEATDGGDGSDSDDDGSTEIRDQQRTVRFAITHEGESNVRIRLLDREGRRVAGILNDRGSVDTVETDELDPGIYVLDVQAEGEWTIDVEFE